MKAGQFRTYFIVLLIIAAICGDRVVNTWGSLGFHDPMAPHIDHTDSGYSDSNDDKHPHLVLPAAINGTYSWINPEIIASFLDPTPVKLFCPQLHSASLFPSRASPV